MKLFKNTRLTEASDNDLLKVRTENGIKVLTRETMKFKNKANAYASVAAQTAVVNDKIANELSSLGWYIEGVGAGDGNDVSMTIRVVVPNDKDYDKNLDTLKKLVKKYLPKVKEFGVNKDQSTDCRFWFRINE